MRLPLPASPLPAVDLSTLSGRRLGSMRRAARDLLDVLEAFTREGRHPVQDAISSPAENFARALHYPSADVEDPDTGCAWYYHAHDADQAMSCRGAAPFPSTDRDDAARKRHGYPLTGQGQSTRVYREPKRAGDRKHRGGS
jgi:hypothetical protein